MPCYRCGARQADPKRGPSPWKRGVRAGTQVLVCPDCQRVHDWTADLDRCATCGSTMLVRALGDTTCRACGATRPGAETRLTPTGPDPALAAEVDAALDRVLRGPGPQ
jgi:hypothetical protein